MFYRLKIILNKKIEIKEIPTANIGPIASFNLRVLCKSQRNLGAL